MPSSRCPRSSRSRKTGLNVDLNVPPIENPDQVGTSMCSNHQFGVGGQGVGVPAALIDLEAVDDDVIISSPRAFAEAKNKTQRNHEQPVVVDVDSATQSNRHKRRRVHGNQTSRNCDNYINLEASGNSARENVKPPAPPKEPTFNCPVCMGPLVEETSTKCGHIFCNVCIKAAIAAQKKCPTCRRKLTSKDTIRVYLPATSCA